MKIISWNVNGLRAIYQRGFVDILTNLDADIICLQEIKADKDQLPPELMNLKNYYLTINSANKKGYSGVLVYSKEKPVSINYRLGLDRFDKEGRYLEVDFPNFKLINTYLPHGDRTKRNLPYKLNCYQALFGRLRTYKNQNTVLIGDFNIAHQEIDLARPKQNANNIMFTPIERNQIDTLLKLGFVDSFRKFNKESGNYTWLSYLKNARERGLGWRIDYGFASKSLDNKVKNAFILPEVRGSDHVPIGLEIT